MSAPPYLAILSSILAAAVALALLLLETPIAPASGIEFDPDTLNTAMSNLHKDNDDGSMATSSEDSSTQRPTIADLA